MSFASTYVLASRVRSKLTKQAADPKSSLRNLVLQANMLDNLMDHISTKTKNLKTQSSVQFSVPEPVKHEMHAAGDRVNGPSVTEYEIDSDLDLDFDSDSDSDSEYDSDSDEYSYSEMDTVEPVSFARKNTMPVIDLASDSQLLVIAEEVDEDEVPDLTHLMSSSESESDSEDSLPHYVYTSSKYAQSNDKLASIDSVLRTGGANFAAHHERHDAIYSVESMI